MKVVIIPTLSLTVAAGKKYRPVALAITNAFTVIGFIGASTPDEVDDLDNHEFHLTFGMIVLTNLILMALTGTYSNLVVPSFLSILFISLAAGRIWWIRRDVVSALEPSTTRVYGTIIAMMYAEASSLRMTNSLSML
jgi:hypothetical protein